MKRILIAISALFVLFMCQACGASDSGLFFNISASGNSGNVSLTLCLNGNGPLSCQNYNIKALSLSITTTIPNHVYPGAGIRVNTPGYTIANLGVDCTLNNVGYCIFSANNTTPKGITIHSSSTPIPPVNAYISNFSASNISFCSLNSNGTFGICQLLADPSFNGPSISFINSAGTLMYVPDGNNSTVSICPINSNGTLATCSATTGSGTFGSPNQTIINSQGTILYVVNALGSISICPINSDGTLGACNSFTDPTFNSPYNIAINPAGTFMYVANDGGNNISICPINSDGSLRTCSSFTDPSFGALNGEALNRAGTLLYVGNFYSNTISICPVNSNGSLSTCSATADPTFNGVDAVNINSGGTLLYVSNFGTGGTNNTISICPVNSNGSLGSCTATTGNNTIFGPSGVSFG